MNVVDKPISPLPENGEPASQGQKRDPLARKKAIAALLLIICVIGASLLLSQSWRSAPPTSSQGNTAALPKPWCAAPAALSSNFAGTSLSGLAENDVWSAGAQIMYWDGHKWGVVFGPPSPQDVFRSIVEIVPNNVWVVGEHLIGGLASQTLTIHWGGMGWQTVKSPNATTNGKNTLVAVSGVALNDVWAVGFFIPQQGQISPLIEHWDGTQWSIATNLNAPDGTQFTSVKALSSNDVWAVGYAAAAGKTGSQPVTEHWNGTQWSAVANPNLDAFGGGSFYNVNGSSANDLWAVGSIKNGMLTEHWDGKSWSMITSPSVPPDSSDWLASVAASGPNNAWAVGRVGNSTAGFQSFIEHWDGHQWQTKQNPMQDAGELDIVMAVGHQFWIAGLPKTSGGHAFIETLCPQIGY